MVIKELIGIYLQKDALHYCCAARTLSSWQLAVPGSAMEPSGVLNGLPIATLREFLHRLSPKMGRQIFLALPRNRFFVRDIQLPPIPLEDALQSVENTLAMTCHLQLEEIYHSVYLCRMPDGRVNAMLIYAPRKEILPILEIFRELGHEKSLAGLFPISFAIGEWIDLQKYPTPMGLIIPQENATNELVVFHKTGCVYSTCWQHDTILNEEAVIRQSACAKFQLSADCFYHFDGPGDEELLPDPLRNNLPWLPPVQSNPGAAALAAGLSERQRVLLNGQPPRIKVFHLWKVFVPMVVVFSLVLSLWTVQLQRKIKDESMAVSALKNETHQLQQQVRPLEKKSDALKKVESLSADIEDFVRLRPRLFSCFNEIAKLVPEGTWFSRTSFQGAELSLNGQSKDAMKVVESLRSSPMFDQVKLMGSVSRNPAGTEQFGLTLHLKDVETSP